MRREKKRTAVTIIKLNVLLCLLYGWFINFIIAAFHFSVILLNEVCVFAFFVCFRGGRCFYSLSPSILQVLVRVYMFGIYNQSRFRWQSSPQVTNTNTHNIHLALPSFIYFMLHIFHSCNVVCRCRWQFCTISLYSLYSQCTALTRSVGAHGGETAEIHFAWNQTVFSASIWLLRRRKIFSILLLIYIEIK